MHKGKWLLVMLLVCSGCQSGCLVDYDADSTLRIGCAGDSNTLLNDSWCERAAALMPQARAIRGTEIGVIEPTAWAKHAVVGQPACNHGAIDMAEPLVNDGADIIIVALGTNDINGWGIPPKTVVGCLEDLQAFLGMRQLFVALTPPVNPPVVNAAAKNVLIDDLNTRLRTAFPTASIIDFHDGFTVDLFYPDGVHLNPAGQQLRAERAVAALRRPHDAVRGRTAPAAAHA